MTKERRSFIDLWSVGKVTSYPARKSAPEVLEPRESEYTRLLYAVREDIFLLSANRSSDAGIEYLSELLVVPFVTDKSQQEEHGFSIGFIDPADQSEQMGSVRTHRYGPQDRVPLDNMPDWGTNYSMYRDENTAVPIISFVFSETATSLTYTPVQVTDSGLLLDGGHSKSPRIISLGRINPHIRNAIAKYHHPHLAK